MKKTLALLLALIMLAASFAACGETTPAGETQQNPTGTAAPSSSGADTAGEAAKGYGGTFKDSILSSVTTINTLTTTDTYPAALRAYVNTNLYTDFVNEDGKTYSYVPMLAADEPQQMDEEGKVWQIKLRNNYKWQNGEIMNADTCIYTWQVVLDPYLLNINANNFYNHTYVKIKGAAEYQQQASLGIEVPWEEVGLKKIDDFTVQLELLTPCDTGHIKKFFSSTTSGMIYEPLFEQCKSADGTSSTYGTSKETFMCSGEYFIDEWVTDAKYTFVKNPDYVWADKIHFERVEYRVVPDSNTALEMFLKGDLDVATITYTQWQDYEDDPRVFEYWDDSTMYLYLNTGNPKFNNMLGNVNFRRAINYGIDRINIANALGAYPYSRLYRRPVEGDPLTGVAFIDMPGADYAEDPYAMYIPTKANEYLDKAFEETQQVNVEFEIYYKEDGTHTRAATELMQREITKNLEGVNITIRAVPQAQAYSLRRWDPDNPTSFDMNIGSLLPGTEPIDTMKFYQSGYKPPRFYWTNEENLARFDALYKECEENLTDNAKVVELCQQMEKILLVDEVMQIPVYEVPQKALFGANVRLPVENYINGYGFGKHQAWFENN